MGNKAKLTAEYFPHYAAQKKTVPILKSKFGSDGYSFWYQLLEMLCAARGHFLNCSAPGDIDFMAVQMGIPVETIELILRELLFRGKIDRELWETDRIIWCQGLVDNLTETLYSKRTGDPVKPLPSRKGGGGLKAFPARKSDCFPGNGNCRDGNAIDSPELPGSKVKESKGKESKEKPLVRTPENPEFRRLAFLLHLKIKSRNPGQKDPNWKTWTEEIRKAIEVDGRTPEDVEKIINWCQADEFWQNNILSTAKLREKFDALVLKSGILKAHESEPETNLDDWHEIERAKAGRVSAEI